MSSVTGIKRKSDKSESSESDSSDSDYDVEDNVTPSNGTASGKTSKKVGFEVVSQDPGKFNRQ